MGEPFSHSSTAEQGAVNSKVPGSNPGVRALCFFMKEDFMFYVFKVLNPDGTDFKIHPAAKFFKVTVEAETLEDAEQEALLQARGFTGNPEVTVQYLPEGR